MSSNGVPIQEISDTVGHKSSHVTWTVYRHVIVPAIGGERQSWPVSSAQKPERSFLVPLGTSERLCRSAGPKSPDHLWGCPSGRGAARRQPGRLHATQHMRLSVCAGHATSKTNSLVLFHRTGIRKIVELRGFEPLTFCMPCRRATSCAIAPQLHPSGGTEIAYRFLARVSYSTKTRPANAPELP